jgi:hypothetical protein
MRGILALPLAQVLLRLDGHDARRRSTARCSGGWPGGDCDVRRDYTLLGLEVVKQALARSPDQVRIHEDKRDDPCALRLSSRSLDADRTEVGVWWWPPMPPLPLSHPSASSVTVWSTSCLSAPFACPAFTSSDVLDLYLHRGSFETVLADEDGEQDPDRWCSHTPNGQECWQILCQWVWNLRLELGQQLSSSALRTTEFAEAVVVEPEPFVEPAPVSTQTPPVKYGPPNFARPSFTHGFPGSAFTLQPDGTLRCPADRPLYPQERRPERDGSIRLLYAARIGHCRCCPLRAQCQESSSSVKPRRVSAVLWPLESSLSDASPPLEDAPEALPLAPVLWKDWPRCHIRRAWLKIIRSETIGLTSGTTPTQEVFTRAQRAHWRLSWDQRVTRNARLSDAPRLFVTLHGLPATFAQSFGFALLATA